MRSISAIIFATGLFLSSVNGQMSSPAGQASVKNDLRKLSFENSTILSDSLKNGVSKTIEQIGSGKIKPDELSATIIDITDPGNIKTANYNGEMQIYSASVVKLYYLAAIHRWLEDKTISLTPELERGLRDMIVDSSNDATQYILDVLTDTASGGEMPDKEFLEWSYKRNKVNRFYSSLGYKNINVNQKTYCEDAYGREQQFRNYRGDNRNMLTSNATARLMAEIALLQFVSEDRSKKMLELLKRDPFSKTTDNEDQAHGFTGISLIELGLKDAKLYSKAGWTSSTRHDVAYIDLANGKKLVVAVFTKNHAKERMLIPGIVSHILRTLNTTN